MVRMERLQSLTKEDVEKLVEKKIGERSMARGFKCIQHD